MFSLGKENLSPAFLGENPASRDTWLGLEVRLSGLEVECLLLMNEALS